MGTNTSLHQSKVRSMEITLYSVNVQDSTVVDRTYRVSSMNHVVLSARGRQPVTERLWIVQIPKHAISIVLQQRRANKLTVYCRWSPLYLYNDQMTVNWPASGGIGSLNCNGEAACYGVEFPMPTATSTYNLQCGSSYECQEAIIHCPTYASCDITCGALQSCYNVCVVVCSLFTIHAHTKWCT